MHSDVIYWSTLHAPAGERRIGPTAVYLLSKRPCRVIIETENRRPDAQPDACSPSTTRARLTPPGSDSPVPAARLLSDCSAEAIPEKPGAWLSPSDSTMPLQRAEFDRRARLDPLPERGGGAGVEGAAGERALGAQRFLDRGLAEPEHELALAVGERQREREVRQLDRDRGFGARDRGGRGLGARFAVGARELRRPRRARARGSWR